SKTSGTNGFVYRISQDGGVNWVIEDYASFSAVPLDDFRAVTRHGNAFFALTHEGTSSSATEIYSMPAGGTAPVNAALELSLTGEINCSGIAADDSYFYLTCGTDNRLIRVDRTTAAVTLIGTYHNLSTTKTAVYASDTNADGTADVLYYHGATREVHYVCDPSGTPFFGTLATYGTSTSTTNYGLAFDPVANVLYAYDDGSQSIVVIQ